MAKKHLIYIHEDDKFHQIPPGQRSKIINLLLGKYFKRLAKKDKRPLKK